MKKFIGKLLIAILATCKNAKILDVAITMLFYLFVSIAIEFIGWVLNNSQPLLLSATLDYFWMLGAHLILNVIDWYEKISD